MNAIMLITKTVQYEIHNINGLAAVMAEILGGALVEHYLQRSRNPMFRASNPKFMSL